MHMDKNDSNNLAVMTVVLIVMMGIVAMIMVGAVLAKDIVVDYTDCIRSIHAEIPLVYATRFPNPLDFGDTSSMCQQR
jgi:hypothetical protein